MCLGLRRQCRLQIYEFVPNAMCWLWLAKVVLFLVHARLARRHLGAQLITKHCVVEALSPASRAPRRCSLAQRQAAQRAAWLEVMQPEFRKRRERSAAAIRLGN